MKTVMKPELLDVGARASRGVGRVSVEEQVPPATEPPCGCQAIPGPLFLLRSQKLCFQYFSQ